MDDLLTIPRPTLRARGPELGPAIAIGVVLAVLFAVVALAARPVDTVTMAVDNPTDYRSEVSVRSAASESWTGLGSVDRNSSVEFLQVPDQGSDWVVRFSYAGETHVMEVGRDQLEATGWTIQVPDDLSERLEESGVPETTARPDGQ